MHAGKFNYLSRKVIGPKDTGWLVSPWTLEGQHIRAESTAMSHQTVMVVDGDTALLAAVTNLMQFHLLDVHVQPFDSPR